MSPAEPDLAIMSARLAFDQLLKTLKPIILTFIQKTAR
jgi:hypothetical protein